MARYVQIARPQKSPRAIRRVPHAIATATRHGEIRARAPAFDSDIALELAALRRPAPLDAGPYLDYRRMLTPEGGVHITYKDLDTRLRQYVWRVFAWAAYMSLESWLLLSHSPVQSDAINWLCLAAMAGLNFLILWRLPEVYRTVEIRPDCMVLDGRDTFWLSRMENGLPAFRQEDEETSVLCGVYGTRFVEYLTARRFDEYDRMPEVLAAHLQDAMQQLWMSPLALGAARESGRQSF
jgi:hypothetical protein